MRLYLDTCCLNRPFDDQSQPRVRRETDAVADILRRVIDGDWIWLGSEVLELEVAANPDPVSRGRVQRLVRYAGDSVHLDAAVIARAQTLASFSIHPFDCQHIASAELGRANVFLTTDDRLLRAAVRARRSLAVPVRNPLEWLEETEQW
jgi:hypothetical protein